MTLAPGAPAGASALRRIARVALRSEARQRFLHDWQRHFAGEPALPAGPIRKVAVVCTGNICRSPFAAALLVAARPDLRVTSHGLATTPGKPADPNALRFAREWGCDLASHRTSGFGEDARAADLILAMDVVQGRAIARGWPAARARLRLLGDFLPARPFAIPDPFAQTDAFWRATCAQLAEAVDRLVTRLGDRG